MNATPPRVCATPWQYWRNAPGALVQGLRLRESGRIIRMLLAAGADVNTRLLEFSDQNYTDTRWKLLSREIGSPLGVPARRRDAPTTSRDFLPLSGKNQGARRLAYEKAHCSRSSRCWRRVPQLPPARRRLVLGPRGRLWALKALTPSRKNTRRDPKPRR